MKMNKINTFQLNEFYFTTLFGINWGTNIVCHCYTNTYAVLLCCCHTLREICVKAIYFFVFYSRSSLVFKQNIWKNNSQNNKIYLL